MFGRQKKHNEPRARTTDPQPRSTVFSYHANRSIREGTHLGRLSPDNPALSKRRKRTAWLHRLPMLLFLGVIVTCCLIILNLSTQVKVISITSSDPRARLFLRDTSTYQQAAQRLFASSLLNRNKLTVNASGIAKTLKDEFPELQSVSIALPIGGHRPIVYVQPANPALFLIARGGGVYILDRSGRALAAGDEAASHVSQLQVPTVQDESGVHIEVGQVAVPSGDVNFIAQVAGQLQAKGLQVESLRLPAASSECNVKLTGVNYVVKFNMHGDARVQAGAFLAAKQQLEGQHAAPSQYFDVRVPERVYYK